MIPLMLVILMLTADDAKMVVHSSHVLFVVLDLPLPLSCMHTHASQARAVVACMLLQSGLKH